MTVYEASPTFYVHISRKSVGWHWTGNVFADFLRDGTHRIAAINESMILHTHPLSRPSMIFFSSSSVSEES